MTTRADPISVFGVIAAAIFGPETAGYVGVHATIIACAFIGALFTVHRFGEDGKPMKNPARYFLMVIVMAVLLTSSLANVVVSWFPSVDASNFIAPVAMIIGASGRQFHRITEVVKKIFDKYLGDK